MSATEELIRLIIEMTDEQLERFLNHPDVKEILKESNYPFKV